MSPFLMFVAKRFFWTNPNGKTYNEGTLKRR